MTRNPLRQLQEKGQSVWLDNLTRAALRDGRLQRLVDQDGLSGVTSNPAIFHKAMTKGSDYENAIIALAREGAAAREIYETLAIEDIRAAADLLAVTFARTGGDDGFVSLEVSPRLARDTRGTIDEAERLWKMVDRPNVFIKIPGTLEGVPAIEECLARGIPINVTLLFSTAAHERVIEAFWRALERRRDQKKPLGEVRSVASYFLSRIDTHVDAQLDEMAEQGDHGNEVRALRGKAAIASAKIAYALWTDLHRSERWKALEQAGARPQKTLWASTSTKDDAYSDVRYIEALIGPQTINTMPDDTLDAFRDHGRVADTLTRGVDEARDEVARLAKIGIDLDQVADALVQEGIEKFIKPFDGLLDTLESKRERTRIA